MPYLRFSRDKRGYENTFVVHTERRRGRSLPRVLYWFRTPPGVKVGRAALDEDAIRLIEEFNPDVEFDWTRILKGQGAPTEAAAPPRQQRPAPMQKRGSPPGRPWKVHGPRSGGATTQGGWTEQIEVPAAEAPAPDAVDREKDRAVPPGPEAATAEGEGGELQEPLGIALTAQPEEAVESPTAAHRRLGSEGVLRLRGRYAEIMARISERIVEPVRREELKAHAERLNPDTWVTDEEVGTGLEQYESVFASLRTVVGRQRRRRRKSDPRGASAPSRPAEADALERGTAASELSDRPDDDHDDLDDKEPERG